MKRFLLAGCLTVLMPAVWGQSLPAGKAPFQFVIPKVEDQFEGCGGRIERMTDPGPNINAATCNCLIARRGWHLIGGTGKFACYFLNPPPSFDPSHASPKELEAWGLPANDLPLLGDTKRRTLYLSNVDRRIYGADLGRVVKPSVTTFWCSPTALPCPRWPGHDLCPAYVGGPGMPPPPPLQCSHSRCIMPAYLPITSE